MPQQVAEGRELAAVAAVLPALRLGTALNHADVMGVGRRGNGRRVAIRRHDVGDGSVEEWRGVAADREGRWPAAAVSC